MKNKTKNKNEDQEEVDATISDVELVEEIKISDLIDGKVKNTVIFETEIYDFSK